MPRSICLIEDGGLVPLTVRSDFGAEAKLQALIDTGSQYTVIDEDLAKQLQLVPLRQEPIGSVNQPTLLTVYRAELEIPPPGNPRTWRGPGREAGGGKAGGAIGPGAVAGVSFRLRRSFRKCDPYEIEAFELE